MNQSQAQDTVLAVMLITAVTVAWTDLKKTGHPSPSFKQLIAFVTLGGVLAIGASVAPEIAGPFAILIGLAIVTSRIGAAS